MPNTKQHKTAKKNKRRHERQKTLRTKELMNAKIGTLRKMTGLPQAVKDKKLPNG